MANYHEEMRQSLMDSCQVTANHDTEDEDDAKARGIENNDASMKEQENAPQQLDKNLQEAAEEDEDDSDSKFNEDLLCEHGKFSLERKRMVGGGKGGRKGGRVGTEGGNRGWEPGVGTGGGNRGWEEGREGRREGWEEEKEGGREGW